MLEDLNLEAIKDETARRTIKMLLNLIEELKVENRQLREEVQRLQDENNRLKGEQGKPNIKANKEEKEKTNSNHSSEKERSKKQERESSSKVEEIKIDREQILKLDVTKLPKDAEFKGYDEVVVQDIEIKTDNIKFFKEKYYSESEKKAYLAELPAGYKGQFGPGVKSLALVFYYACNMAEPKILEFFTNVGIRISAGHLSNMLIKDQEEFHKEKEAVYQAGLSSSPWQNMDDTSTRVDGQNQHCHIVCNPLYTAYFTTEKKDRLTVIDVLRNMRERKFRLNGETYGFLREFRLAERIITKLENLPQEQEITEENFTKLLEENLPNLGIQQRKHILEAAAVTAYNAQIGFPVVKLLICDDAPQFKLVTQELALCWVHDGRHYKKLAPFVAHHRKLLENFLDSYWKFYNKLLTYQNNPTAAQAAMLEQEFDDLFSTVTGYNALDERIAKTKAKKESLLMVLQHPEIPLHNNPAELGARQRVRKRDVSFGPRTSDGKNAWDTFNTLVGTAKKLGVQFFHYIKDRITGAKQILPLNELIDQKAKELNLGASWDST